MSLISLSKMNTVVAEFAETRLIPSAPPLVKFLIGGAIPLVNNKINDIINQYVPIGKQLGLINNSNQLDIDKFKQAIDNGFNTSGNINALGFIFTREDGQQLISIIEKYKD